MNLYSYQEEAVKRALAHDAYALFTDPGTGKTIMALEIVKRRTAALGRKLKVLVICPLSIIEQTWIKEARAYFPDYGIYNYWSNRGADSRDLSIINFEGLRKLPDEVIDGLDMIIVDESSRIKNFKAQVTQRILSFTDRVRYRLIMSGTPAPNSALEYWPQMYFVNKSIFNPWQRRTLSQNYYSFRAENFVSYGYGNYLWKPRASFIENLPRLLGRQSFSIKKEDCLDLPDKVFVRRAYEMQGRQKKFYDEFLAENIAQIQDRTILGANELAKIMKLRQVTSGFVLSEAGAGAYWFGEGKMAVLSEVLEEIGDKQVIIWAQFHEEITAIQSLLGEKAVMLYGDMSQGDKELSITDFQEGRAQYLIAHPKSGGMGLTFTNCHYVVYFSLSYSLEEFQQSQDRTHRIGQKNKVTYFYLLANDSVDFVILKALERKEKMSDAILEMINAGEGISQAVPGGVS